VPAWQRDTPLLYAGAQLVFVPGLGIDARALALPGTPRVSIEWQRGR
jgi:tRNA(Ile)-lysidine synthase